MAKHGRYNIVRRVADGGMAEIFLATQVGREGFQKPVILKRIHSTIYADPQFRNMFIDEAHISMSLAHSNIAQVLDLGVAQGRYFLVLELVDGWDLGRVLQRAATANIPLPRELGLHIIADVCRALSYAHSKTDGARSLGIVHRDVSPHNILLSEQGEIKLTDFGIAKAMNKREQTGTGVVKGKVAFMSPEQAYGKPIDQRSDLFSLGTVLYLLMVRSRPFEGPTDLETLLRVQKGEFLPPEAAAPDLEPEVAAIINRALKTDVNERYQTADEMLADIEHVARNVFRPVGQTELKRWLAELALHDGQPSILKMTSRPTSTRAGTGTGELDGQDVVLSDSQELQEDEIDGEARTSLAVVEAAGGGRMRMSRARVSQQPPEFSLPVPRDSESALDGRASEELAALPIPETEEPPDRRRKRKGGGFFKVMMGLAVLFAVAYFGGTYYRTWFGGGESPQAGTANPPTEAKPVAETPKPVVQAPKPAPVPVQKPAVQKPAPAATREPAEAKTAEPAKEEAKSEKPVARKTRTPAERTPVKERDRLHTIDLKSMMAPDPSQLPAPEPAKPPPAPPSDPAQ
ncbi:MAG TPA: protein kinase [Polyangia bacterium]|nr:protein kinase [Polyangia bacterium]